MSCLISGPRQEMKVPPPPPRPNVGRVPLNLYSVGRAVFSLDLVCVCVCVGGGGGGGGDSTKIDHIKHSHDHIKG